MLGEIFMTEILTLEGTTIIYQTTITIQTSPEHLWTFFTETENIIKWFPELQVVQNERPTAWCFVIDDFEELLPFITFKPMKQLNVTWDTGNIQFILKKKDTQETELAFRDYLPDSFTTERSRDIAGWFIVLQRLKQAIEHPEKDFIEPDFSSIEQRYLEKVTELLRIQ